MLLKNAVIRSTWQMSVAILVATCFAFTGCRGEGTFFSSILDDGGGFDAAFTLDAGMDASAVCIACGVGCFDCGLGCMCGDLDAGRDASIPWASPFPTMGAPGFRNSNDTLCAEVNIDGNAIDVWSDDRGVFALATGHVREFGNVDAGSWPCEARGCPVERLLRNDGNGWQLQREGFAVGEGADVDAVGLRGAISGPLFVRRTAADLPPDFCGLTAIDGVNDRCALGQTRVSSMFVVTESNAYALESETVRRFDGTAWNIVANVPTPITAPLWADASRALAIGTAGQLYELTTANNWNTIGALTLHQSSALWATSVNDVWIGTANGQLSHFDGQAWQQVGSIGGTTCSTNNRVLGIWGSSDTVYFYGARSFMRWNGSGLENLATWACAPNFASTTIQDVWGNGDNEVFIGLRDESAATDTCGGSIVVRFDGTQFHRM